MQEMSQATDFSKLFEAKYKTLEVKEGTLLSGTVVELTRDHVIVDIGFKSEGLINKEEFRNFDGAITVQPGDPVEVVVDQLEDPKGLIILSKERADALKAWDRVANVYDKDESIEGVIVNKIKGGMSVNLGGVKAFLPGSQIDLKPIKSLDKLIGYKCYFKILKLNKAKGNIVVSRRVVLEKEREAQKKELLANLKEGQVVKGAIKNLTDYGAFVDLGGIDGLLHITDMSWGRINHPNEVFKIGQEIEVTVLKYEKDKDKVSLGYKQLKADPWQDVDTKFARGQTVKGQAINVTDYGVFIGLEDGIDGLVHVSELTWNKRIKHPNKLVKQGDTVEAVILDIDSANRKISLGMKQLEKNPWEGLFEKYPAGSRVKGKVQNITDFGVFVSIEGEEIDGLVHISDLTWDKKLGHPSEVIKKGDNVEAIVLSIDKDNERFSLGIKQLSDNPWDLVQKTFRMGLPVTGQIKEVDAKGILLTLPGDIAGYIAKSDLSGEGSFELKDKFQIGTELTAQVKKLDERQKKVILSMKALEKSQEKHHMKEFLAKQGDATVKLEDTIKKAKKKKS